MNICLVLRSRAAESAARSLLWVNWGKEPDSAPFDYHSQSTLVRKTKSFGVDAEWIPGEERCQWGETTAMKPSPNHLSVASVAGRRRRSPESARSAGPRRWVGQRGGCALRGVRTGVNCLRHPARGGVGMTASICARAHATVRWYRLTGVRLVRHTSVDHRGLLLSRVSRGNMGASSQFKGGGQNKFD